LNSSEIFGILLAKMNTGSRMLGDRIT